MRRCEVFRLPTAHPADVGALLALIGSGRIRAHDIRAILGKTEGNGCVNDFTRAYALSALRTALSDPLACHPDHVGDRIAMVMSGGTEGGLSPHLLVFTETESAPVAHPAGTLATAKSPTGKPPTGKPPIGKSLAIGKAATRALRPEEIGRISQIKATAEAVTTAMTQADITRGEDVHYVQVKCPLLTAERVAQAAARGHTVATADAYKSMAVSRGASALGVALALKEISPDALDDTAVCRRLDLWSGRASASAGIELMHNEVIVLGNSPSWASDAVIAHRVMRDAIDLPAASAALADAGLAVSDLAVTGQLDQQAADHLLAVLAKADPATSGQIRGARHIMLDDSDINATRHARALVGGVLAGLTGRTDLFVSGGAEHQGPDGGGPIAVIVRRQVSR
ncbi:ring-opening amidohydrolase [Rhodopila sp.]|uniref:cyanuric acid amidohydrolase n=1 Tax=Rhodopila sp. TaxID=2480087 RepID=UPI003D0D4F56